MSGRNRMWVHCLLALLGLSACSSTRPLATAQPREVQAEALPVAIDTDMAPDVDVRAITVTGTGEAHCAPGVRHALDLAGLAGRPDIPVACGREMPLQGEHAFPASWRERVDALYGLSLPQNPRAPSELSAVELLAQVVRESARPVHVLALGPLTNVAGLLQAEPDLARKIAMITVMGGAVRVPGNVGPSSDIDNPFAEWNLYVDPRAAAIVVASGAPVTLVPLDATNHAPVSLAFYRRLGRDRSAPTAEFAYRVLSQIVEPIRSGMYYFWDPLAAALVTDGDVGTFEQLPIVVIEAEGPESGRTLERDDGHLVRVAVGADCERFEGLLVDALNCRSGP